MNEQASNNNLTTQKRRDEVLDQVRDHLLYEGVAIERKDWKEQRRQREIINSLMKFWRKLGDENNG